MAPATMGDTVRITYSCFTDDGAVYDYEESREPLEFTIGEGSTIPRLEEAVLGMEPGETRQVRIPASEITGVTLDKMASALGLREAPGEVTRVTRQIDIAPDAAGDVAEVLVPGVAGAKYSLAGRDLTFEVRLLEITQRSG